MPVLQFKGKSAVETHHHTVPHCRLEFDAKLSLLAKGEKPSLEGNVIIEGDNLLALKALLPTHAGRIKCIYIDPPYNTGNEGWVYNDNLTQPQFKDWIGKTVGKEGEDFNRHDKWCCMMYPRLQLLRELLRDNGAIFVSIDDNEVQHLRMLMDEVFLTDKPLASFVWKRRSPTGMRDDFVSVDHEYVLLYAKNPSQVSLAGLVTTEADYPFVEGERRYASTDLTVGMTKEDRPNQFFTLVNPRTGAEYPPNPNRVWRFEPTSMKQVVADNLVIWPDESEGEMTRPRYKTYFDPADPKIKPVSSWIETSTHRESEADLDADDDLEILSSGLNSEGGRILQRIMGRKTIDYPKPLSIVKSLLRIATKDDDIVLDSFAGSGTTGQAALELNRDDGGHRKCILIQLKHDNMDQQEAGENLCESVTAERIRRVIRGYSYKSNGRKAQKVEGLGGAYSYTRIGAPLWGEYRDMGEDRPPFEDLAKYIFYTETSRECDPKKFNRETGFIGQTEAAGGTSYFLFYPANGPDVHNEVSLKTLKTLLKSDKNKYWVIYAEKIWLQADDLRAFEIENNRHVRPMQVPYQIK